MLLNVQQCSSAGALSRSVSRHAAIDGNLLPGDVARSIRREKADRFGNFFSGTGNADRDHRFRNLVRIENMRAGRSVPGTADFLRTMLAPGWRINDAGMDRVDADLVAQTRALERNGLGHHPNGTLGPAIGGHARQAL